MGAFRDLRASPPPPGRPGQAPVGYLVRPVDHRRRALLRRARLNRDNLAAAPHLAFTRVLLRNRGDDDLLLERINLPVPELALFVGAGGALWTQTVCLERGADGKLAEVRIEDEPPAEAGPGARRLAEPRAGAAGNVFSRAMSALLG